VTAGRSAGRVVVVGLGPAGPELVSAGTLELIAGAAHAFVRTTRHPSASLMPDAVAFDDVYERSATMDEVYVTIVDRLLDEASAHGEALYAVPGSPMVAERTVQLLLASDVETVVHPALSFLDLVWTRLGVDPLSDGVRLVDGHRFSVDAAGQRGPLLVAQCDSPLVLSDIKLAVDDPPGGAVTLLHHLGLPDEEVRQVAWAELDHGPLVPDHLTSLYIPQLAAPVGAELLRFDELVRTLRAACPWDREQTHESLRRHLLEEAGEVAEAIDELAGGGAAAIAHLEEELGDLLYQVYFHATLASEEGWFTLADVARGIHDKLVRRHPHVFAGADADTPESVELLWEQIKQAERAERAETSAAEAATQRSVENDGA
jgi:tetrapyrrole methylase family protein/MazG family protein